MNDSVNELHVRKLNDQFSGATRAVRRNLIISASIGIVLSAHTLKLTDVFGIDMRDSATASIAIGAVALIAAYELLSFMAYAVIDHMSWRLNAHSVIHRTQFDRLRDIAEHTRRTMDQLLHIRGKMTSDDDSVVDAIKSQSGVIDGICSKADLVVSTYEKDIAHLKARVKAHNYVQLFRVYAIDWAIPLVVGVTCMVRNWHSMGDFLQAVFLWA
ncbi:hypothetical protein [Pseudomonas pseudonitroreducens]|uniref:hypothetical protein n=1 Tax=Pseudomonas pseudonitroreducens TaxID=2892326 RepID=UPI001F28593F|nr:hypothetical protein [Pseudomonas pseudonitroreducens]